MSKIRGERRDKHRGKDRREATRTPGKFKRTLDIAHAVMRNRFLEDCARVKVKLDEIQQDERRRQFYRPLRRPFKVVRRQVDPLDALLEYWHDRICVFKDDPIAISILPKITLP